jgi:FkbM family methyltransferase
MDGLAYFQKELRKISFPPYFGSRDAHRIAWRLVGFERWIKQKGSLKEAFQNILPGRLKPEGVKRGISNYVREKLDKTFSTQGLYDLDHISMFGRPFYPLYEDTKLNSWFSAFKTIGEVIVCDQYHAKDFIKEDSTVIDAGANIGGFSVFAATLAPRGRVYSFEPAPESFAVLKKNIETYSNVTAFQLGLGDAKKTTDLILSYRPEANSLIDSGMVTSFDHADPGKSGWKGDVKVNITTIDDFVLEQDLKRVDFIKIDTEGYEKQIIAGAKRTIRRFSPALCMSAYHHPKDKAEIPALIRSIDSGYNHKLDTRSEEDLLFWK